MRRTPLATARTSPWSRVSRVTMRSASPSLCWRSTTARSGRAASHQFGIAPRHRWDMAATARRYPGQRWQTRRFSASLP
ncbi:hypothetical protein I552_9641 [Mycobacterium xenopi 3993]|nr:hypothetical protein I552_9641 [Mycobacterium xenopi 3993]